MSSNRQGGGREHPRAESVAVGSGGVTHKARIVHDLSFDPNTKGKKGGLNADTEVETVPPCLCAEALPKFLAELVSLRKKCPAKRLLMATTDVNDAFRNVRVDADKAQNFAYKSRRSHCDRIPAPLRMGGISR